MSVDTEGGNPFVVVVVPERPLGRAYLKYGAAKD